MIAHVSIGVRDMAAARRFYDAALEPLGYACKSSGDDSTGYGDGGSSFWLGLTEHPVPADPRSGLHICFGAETRAAVDAFYRAALAAGGRDNGAPGLRPGIFRHLLRGLRHRPRRLPHRGLLQRACLVAAAFLRPGCAPGRLR